MSIARASIAVATTATSVLPSIDQAIDAAVDYASKGRNVSVGVEANAVGLLERMIEPRHHA
ncbi:MAG: hypothetical protein R3B46_12510 [Phycisphaerales bacterium]